MREMDDDFGILPLPLYDENQDRYYNSIASWSGAFYCIPRNAYGDDGFRTFLCIKGIISPV